MVHNQKEVLFFDLDSKRQEIASGFSRNPRDAFEKNQSEKIIEEKMIPKPPNYSNYFLLIDFHNIIIYITY